MRIQFYNDFYPFVHLARQLFLGISPFISDPGSLCLLFSLSPYHACICVRMYMCTMYMCTYVYVYVCICVRMYMCTYV